MSRHCFLAGVLAAALACAAGPASAGEFRSCKDVWDYLNGTKSSEPYTRVKLMENAVEVVNRELSREGATCDELWAERAYFEHANEADLYRKTRTDPASRKTWAADAATAY